MGDPLSQEEIDKLLNSASGDDSSGSADASQEASAEGPELTVADGGADEGGQDAIIEQQASADPAEVIPSAIGVDPGDSVIASQTVPPQQPRDAAVFGASTSSGMSSMQNVQFGQLPGQTGFAEAPRSIDLLLDVRLQLTVELGRKDLTIKEALAMGPGAVVELDRVAGEPVDLFVNNKLIARGEVVVIDENFGVRVTEVVSQAERMSKVA